MMLVLSFSDFWWLSILWSLFGSLLQYGTYYLGCRKRGHNFDNYPIVSADGDDAVGGLGDVESRAGR